MKQILKDREFWFILLFNLLLTVLYLSGEMGIGPIILIYFFQSIFIGLQYFLRMFIGVRDARKQGERINYYSPLFFGGHFGFFHFVYFIFLIGIVSRHHEGLWDQNWKLVILSLLANTLLSTLSDIKSDRENNTPYTGFALMPYLRIVPMHLFIIMAFNQEKDIRMVTLLFLGLKTMADLLTHVLSHQSWKKERPKPLGGMI